MVIERRFTVDLDACRGALRDSDSYVVDVDSMPTVDAAPQVLAAIPVYSETDTIGEVVRDTAVYAEEVLVVVLLLAPEYRKRRSCYCSLVTGSRHALDLLLLNSC